MFDLDRFVGRVGIDLVAGTKADAGNAVLAGDGDAVGAKGPAVEARLFVKEAPCIYNFDSITLKFPY